MNWHRIHSFLFRQNTLYSLKQEARSALRSLGSSVWRMLKESQGHLGIPSTLCNYLDYDDFFDE